MRLGLNILPYLKQFCEHILKQSKLGGSLEFRWNRTKIKGSCTSNVGMAKNRGEPQKMTPSSETEIFLGVVPMGKL